MQKSELEIDVETLQNILIAIATGSSGDESEYRELRIKLINDNKIKKMLPEFLIKNRTMDDFWQFIKRKFATYQERREYIRTEFSRVLIHLDTNQNEIDNSTFKFNQNHIIISQWKKAIERKAEDPEGAITMARTLIETTCKYILGELKIEYKEDIELPKLYKLTAEKLNLAPDQHTEQIFKQILGGCQTVIEGLGSLRNKLSDSHGKKVTQSKPASRHAELAVNLAGTMTTFLLDTYDFNKKTTKPET